MKYESSKMDVFETWMVEADSFHHEKHKHTPGECFVFLASVLHTDYSVGTAHTDFEGAFVDTGSARSVIARNQEHAYFRQSIRTYKLLPSKITFQFGVGGNKAWA